MVVQVRLVTQGTKVFSKAQKDPGGLLTSINQQATILKADV